MRDALKGDELIVFVGAGVSRLVDCPSWLELAHKYLDYLFENEKITYFVKNRLKKLEPKKILTICRRIIKEEKSLPELNLKDVFKTNKQSNIFKDIHSLGAIYITTNYDEYLDKDVRGKVVYSLTQQSYSDCLKRGNVIHLHGSVRVPGTEIMTTAEYIKHYKENEVKDLMKKLFSGQYVLLFVGYGLGELEILEYLVNSNKELLGLDSEPKELSHYLLAPYFEEEESIFELERKYYQSMGVKLVGYSLTKKGYSHLESVIEDLSRQLPPSLSPKKIKHSDFIKNAKKLKEIL